MTTRQDLARIKARALRTRVWFKALSKVERALVDLTIKCVESIRSSVLALKISAIVGKVLQCLEEDFILRAEKVGHKMVEKLCTIGERWGNKSCSTWKRDRCLIRFLGITTLNA